MQDMAECSQALCAPSALAAILKGAASIESNNFSLGCIFRMLIE
jgi:hypothetical protein